MLFERLHLRGVARPSRVDDIAAVTAANDRATHTQDEQHHGNGNADENG
jgi:hypothetical protein